MDGQMDGLKKTPQLRETSVITLPPLVRMPFKITLKTKMLTVSLNYFKLLGKEVMVN